jgi:hypothetical protein
MESFTIDLLASQQVTSLLVQSESQAVISAIFFDPDSSEGGVVSDVFPHLPIMLNVGFTRITFPASITASKIVLWGSNIQGLTSAVINEGSTEFAQLQAFAIQYMNNLGLSQLAQDEEHRTVTDAEKATWNGKADLVDGKLDPNQIPLISLTEFLGTPINQAAMLALTGQKGDWCIRSDQSLHPMWIITGDNPTQIGSWTAVPYPAIPTLLSQLIDDTTHRLVTDTDKTNWNTNIGTKINATTAKATPIDADKFGIWDSVSGLLQGVTWVNVKATLKAYFDPIYTLALLGGVPTSRQINGLDLTADRTLTTANVADSADKRYCTDAQKTVIENTSNTNTGDQYSLFGDKSDGSVTFDGATTILGIVPVGNVYTLTREINCINITINNGVTVNPAGFEIHCAGTLINNGIIDCSGNSGSPGASGTAVPGNGGAAPYTQRLFLASGMAGGNGGGNTGTGTSNGSSTVAVSPLIAVPTAVSANMLAGGGGSGGSSHGAASVAGSAANARLAGAKGGSGGAGLGTGSSEITGGGGGSGGGVILIYAFVLNNAGTIQAKGGQGGNGVTATDKSGNGGGGGGGCIIICYRSTTGSGIGTLTVTGGAAGTGGNGGTAGSDGYTFTYQI